MKKLLSQAGLVAIAFFVNFISNYIVKSFTYPSGDIILGETVEIQEKQYTPVTINNFSNEQIDDITFSIPKDVDIEEIVSSAAIVIKTEDKIAPLSGQTLITISKINPKKITELLIPTGDKRETSRLSVLNYREKKLTVKSTQEVSSLREQILKQALTSAIIYTIIFSIILILFHRRVDKAEEKIKETKKNLKESKKNLKESKKEMRSRTKDLYKKIKEADKRIKEQEILLIARLSDYSKELNFWRNIIKKLVGDPRGRNIGKRIFDLVTNELKTYGVKQEIDSKFETIKTLAGWFNSKTQSPKRKKDK